ncbi:MAG TPA: hypothetical protein VGB15_24570 [Longimicrobium sp.]
MCGSRLARLLAPLFALAACNGARTDGARAEEAVNAPLRVGSHGVAPETVRAYLARHVGFTSRGGTVFCSYAVVGQEGGRVYADVVCEELVAGRDSLESGSGTGVPVALEVDTLPAPRIRAHRRPGDGNRYARDLRAIFPAPVLRRIDLPAARRNERGLRLRAENRRLAAEARIGRSPAAPVEDAGTFAFVANGDTTVVEEYRRAAGVLQGEIRPRVPGGFGRAAYRAELDGELVRRIELSVWPPGAPAGSAPVRRWIATFAGDSVVEETRSGGPTDVRRTAVPPGTLPLFGPSMALQEQIVRRARAIGGSAPTVEVPVHSLATNGPAVRATVEWIGRDSATLRHGGSAMRLRIDADGRILGAVSADSAHRIVRLR